MKFTKEDLLFVVLWRVNNYMSISQEYLETLKNIMKLIILLILLVGELINRPNRNFGMSGIVGEPIGVKMGSLELLEELIILT